MLSFQSHHPRMRSARRSAAHGVAIALAALFTLEVAAAETAIDDPLLVINRPVHVFNKGADRFVLRPVTSGYRQVVPREIRNGIGRVLENLSLPLVAVNHVLQLNPDAAARTSVRFAMNTLIGVGGIFDVATAEGLPREPTDLGLTFAHYGVGEIAYLELPLLGPTTVRDFGGTALSIVVDPAPGTHIDQSKASEYRTGQGILETVDRRSQHYEIVNDLLYSSADSYIALRNSYLQRRRRQVNGDLDDAARVDELPDLFGEFEDEDDAN